MNPQWTDNKTHELKTDNEMFEAVYSGFKGYEIRFDDRGYQVGDWLHLKETEFTGEEMKAGKPLVFTGGPPYLSSRATANRAVPTPSGCLTRRDRQRKRNSSKSS